MKARAVAVRASISFPRDVRDPWDNCQGEEGFLGLGRAGGGGTIHRRQMALVPM